MFFYVYLQACEQVQDFTSRVTSLEHNNEHLKQELERVSKINWFILGFKFTIYYEIYERNIY